MDSHWQKTDRNDMNLENYRQSSDVRGKIDDPNDKYRENSSRNMDARKKKSGKTSTVKAALKKHLLPILTLLGIIGGVGLGFILRNSREHPWSRREVLYVGFLGELFLRALKALIIPLIVSSLVSAVGNLDISMSKKIGRRVIAYYLSTTIMAVILGIVLVITIKPGSSSSSNLSTTPISVREVTTVDLLMDLVRNLFPPNLVQATFQTYRSTVKMPKSLSLDEREVFELKYENWTGLIEDLPKDEWKIGGEYTGSMNIMGLVCFATVLGLAIAKLGRKGKPLLDFFNALSDASMTITSWVIWVSPIGILFLVASMVLKMKSLTVVLGQMGMYFVTVVVGVLIHGFIVLPLIYILIARKLPFTFMKNMSQAYITAFGTASSSATLPVTFDCLEKKNNIDPRISRFVIPIGATINMDGTALYEAVAAIFIAQVRNWPLSIGNIIAISITATAAAIGAAGIPQAGLVTMVMVLDVIGLPAEDVTLVLAIDWLLDRFRTMVNVLGDSIGALLMHELSKNELSIIGKNTYDDDDEFGSLSRNRTKSEHGSIQKYGSLAKSDGLFRGEIDDMTLPKSGIKLRNQADDMHDYDHVNRNGNLLTKFSRNGSIESGILTKNGNVIKKHEYINKTMDTDEDPDSLDVSTKV